MGLYMSAPYWPGSTGERDEQQNLRGLKESPESQDNPNSLLSKFVLLHSLLNSRLSLLYTHSCKHMYINGQN